MKAVTLCYLHSAEKFGLTISHEPHIDGFKIALGKKIYHFRGGDTPFNNASAISIAANKYCMNKTLAKAGFPVPRATAFNKKEFDEAKGKPNQLPFPLVVKPTTGTATGEDVICNIKDEATLHQIMEKLFKKHKLLSVEAFHGRLKSYRVLVFDGKVTGVVLRQSASITGDGTHTIADIIRSENKNRKEFRDKYTAGDIEVDDDFILCLADQQLTLDSIPENGQLIQIANKCNSTCGGDFVSMGTTINSENRALFIEAARTLNLRLVGFDVVCEDINRPIKNTHGAIIEANHNPDISIHETPMSGEPVIVSRAILRKLLWKHPIEFLKLKWNKLKTSKTLIKTAIMIIILLISKHFIISK